MQINATSNSMERQNDRRHQLRRPVALSSAKTKLMVTPLEEDRFNRKGHAPSWSIGI